MILTLAIALAPIWVSPAQTSLLSGYDLQRQFNVSTLAPTIVGVTEVNNQRGQVVCITTEFDFDGFYYYNNYTHEGNVLISSITAKIYGVSESPLGNFQTSITTDIGAYVNDMNVAFKVSWDSAGEYSYQYDIGGSTYYSADFESGYYGYAFSYEIQHYNLNIDLSSEYFATAFDEYLRGYADGLQEGYDLGVVYDATVTSIFAGILEVAMLPINFFLAIFNFEILGVNLTSFITAILTCVIVIMLFRLIMGGSAEGGGKK